MAAAGGGDVAPGDSDIIGRDAIAVFSAISAGGVHSAAGDGEIVVCIDAIAVFFAIFAGGVHGAAGGGHSAARDGDVVVCIDAIAVFFAIFAGGVHISASGVHGAALDNEVVRADTVALRYRTAAGDGQAAVAGDGEVDKLVGVPGKNAIACSAPTATGAGDGVGAHQIYVEVAAPVVPDGGAPQRALGDGRVVEGQGAAVPFDVVIVRVRPFCCNGSIRSRLGIGGGIRSAPRPHAAHEDVALQRLALAVEVFVAGDQVGDASRQYKRRADDFRRAVRILARFHLDGLDRRIALRIQIDGPTPGPQCRRWQ